MVDFKEVFGSWLENIKEAGESVWEVVNRTAKRLREALDPKAVFVWGLLVTGGITWCNQQTPPVNHAPEADITELVEFVQAGELRMPISDLLQMFGVEDPDGDTLSVEVISGPARIEGGYLIVNAGDDVEVKLKISDGKWWELELTLRLDVNHPPEVQNEVVTRSVTLPEWTTSFTLDLDSVVAEIWPTDPDGDPTSVSVDSVEWADGFAVDWRGTVEIFGVPPGASRVVIYLEIKDSNGGETPARVEVNITWEAVDNPTQISDLSVSVLDRPVPNTANAVYSWGQFEVSWTLSDPDGLPSNVTLTLVGAGVSYPVTVNPDGTFSVVVDATWLPAGEYSLKFSGQDASGNLFEITVEVVKVYPWIEVVPSTNLTDGERWSPGSSYEDAYYDSSGPAWWLYLRSSNLYLGMEGVTPEMVWNGDVSIVVIRIGPDEVNKAFIVTELYENPDWTLRVAIDNESLFPWTGNAWSWPENIVLMVVVTGKDGVDYMSPQVETEPVGDGVL